MANKKKEKAQVISQERIAQDIYSMWIKTEAAAEAKPGQFISMYTNDGSKLLPRPISICEIDTENGSLRVVYRVTGKNTGTEEFSKLQAGGYDSCNRTSRERFPCRKGGRQTGFPHGRRHWRTADP